MEFFYGKHVCRESEQEYIAKILEKYKEDPVNEELKKKIWDDLMMEKHAGRVTIPFQLVTRRDPEKKFPDYIEVVLDTKV